MHHTLQTWLDELSEEFEINFSASVEEQANVNMLTFGMSETNLQGWGKESLRDFVLGCRDLFQKKCCGQPMLLYSWYDEQAGQLRLSAISPAHKNPPFECPIECVEMGFFVENIFTDTSGLNTENARLFVWTSTIG